MKRVLLTGKNGTVADVMQKQLADTYDLSGLSIARMDDVISEAGAMTWKDLREAYRNRAMEQLTAAFKGKDAVVHLGWNTEDENYQGGLDPLNILVVDCVYQAAIAANVPRIYMASSVHSYDFTDVMRVDGEPIQPFPDTRENAFGVGTTSLYGVSKRWMETAGQFYAKRLQEGQKILCVRLGAVGREKRPHRSGSRLWNSHEDLAGLLTAFIECDDAPNFWIAFGISDNRGGDYPRPLFDPVNPYGFKPASNACTDVA